MGVWIISNLVMVFGLYLSEVQASSCFLWDSSSQFLAIFALGLACGKTNLPFRLTGAHPVINRLRHQGRIFTYFRWSRNWK